MEEAKIEITGEMDVQTPSKTNTKTSFNFLNVQFQKIPSPTELYQLIRKSMRPWTEFLSTENFKTAPTLPRLTSRFIRNLNYFQYNYIFIFIILMIYCLVTSPLILIVLIALAIISHKINKIQSTVSLFRYQLNTSRQIIAVNIAAIPILFLAGAGAALFWTLGASCFVISLHAVFFNIDSIVTEDAEDFLSEIV